MLTIRKATVADVPMMIRLMEPHVRSEALLPRSARSVVERLRDYVVADDGGALVGLASLALVDEDLAEVGAVVCERSELLESLVEAVLDEARAMGVRRAFLLAPEVAPYAALGFAPTSLDAIPEKRDRQCLRCPRLPRCRQVALVKELDELRAAA